MLPINTMDVVCTGNAGNTSLVVAAVAATNGHGETRKTCGSITYRGTRMWAFFPF